jgi:hypothetical protein
MLSRFFSSSVFVQMAKENIRDQVPQSLHLVDEMRYPRQSKEEEKEKHCWNIRSVIALLVFNK